MNQCDYQNGKLWILCERIVVYLNTNSIPFDPEQNEANEIKKIGLTHSYFVYLA